MDDVSRERLDATVWLIIPAEKAADSDRLRLWLEDQAAPWVEAVRKGAHGALAVRIIALPVGDDPFSGPTRERICTAIAKAIDVVEVGFEPTACLRNVRPADGGCIHALRRSHGCCEEPHRLLLIDPAGRGFPCLGYWRACGQNVAGCGLPDQVRLKDAYANGAFRFLCTECANAPWSGEHHPFPCSALGAHTKSTVWGEGGPYPHVQFGGRDETAGAEGEGGSCQGERCRHFAPIFETSLERSRQRLEDILFRDDFWKQALLDSARQLQEYWPGDAGSAIPIYGSYPVEADSPASLDHYPPSTVFLQEPVDLQKGAAAYQRVQQAFLPICFLPHLRVLFDLVEEVHLLSIVLADRHRDSEFRYRSLYRDGPAGPNCFAEDITWKRLWRLPYEWDAWRENVLNLSSSVRLARASKGGDSPQSVDYLALLSSDQCPTGDLNRSVLDLSGVWEAFRDQFSNRASDMRRTVAAKLYWNPGDYTPALLPLLFLPDRSPDNECGKVAWETAKESLAGPATHLSSPGSQRCDIYVQDGHRHWVPWSQIPEGARAASGCRLLNYLLWLKCVFQNDVHAIETCNSTQVSTKQPSQFVLFCGRPLTPQRRARFKLTLTALLQPIESAYAIGTEIDKHQLQLASTVYAAGHSQKHLFGYMSAPLETLASHKVVKTDPLAHVVVDELRALMSWAENSSKNMDLIASLFLHQGQIDRLDKGFFAPKGTIYCVGAQVRQFVNSILAAGHKLDVTAASWDGMDKVAVVEGIHTETGPRRLWDSFYDELFQEVLFNARRWAAGPLDVTCCRVADILMHVADPACVAAFPLDQEILVFRNRANPSAFRGRRLEPKYVSWLLRAKKGGLCYAAMRLEATGQGQLLVRREEAPGGPFFNLAVILHACRRRSNGGAGV